MAALGTVAKWTGIGAVGGVASEVGKTAIRGFLEGAIGKTAGGAIASAAATRTGAKKSGRQTGPTGDPAKDTSNAVRDLQSDINEQASDIKNISVDIAQVRDTLANIGVNQLTTNQILKSIESKVSGGGGGSRSSLVENAGMIATIAAAARLLGRAVPVIGAGAAGVSEYMQSGDAGRAVSSGAGALGGAYAGRALGGVVGAGVGRLAGGVLGAAAGPIGSGVGLVGGGYLGEKAGTAIYDWLFGSNESASSQKTDAMAELSRKEEQQKRKAAAEVEKQSINFNSKEIVFKADSIKFETTGGGSSSVSGAGISGGPSGGPSGAPGGNSQTAPMAPFVPPGNIPGGSSGGPSGGPSGAPSGAGAGQGGARISGGRGRLGINELYSLAKEAGFSDQEARIMAAIAMGESSGNPNAHNADRRTGDDSYGLWQINMLGRMGPERRRMFGISSDEDLKDPRINARAAYQIYKQQGFRAWSVWSSGKYRQFMGAAARAEPVSVGGAGGAGAGGSITSSGSVPRGAAVPSTPGGGQTYGGLSPSEMQSFGFGGRRVMASDSVGAGMAGRGQMFGPFQPRGRVEEAAAQARIATRGRFLNQGQFGPFKPQGPLEEAAAQARIALRGKLGQEGMLGPFLPTTEDIYGPSDASLRAQDAAAAASAAAGAGGFTGGADAATADVVDKLGEQAALRRAAAATPGAEMDAETVGGVPGFDAQSFARKFEEERSRAYLNSAENTDAMKWAEQQRAKMDAERASMDAEAVGGVAGFDAKKFSADFAAKQAASQQAQQAAADASLATGAGSMTSDDAAINAALFKAQMKRDLEPPQGGLSTTAMIEGGTRLAEQSASLEAYRMKQFQGESRPAAAVQQGFADSPTNEGMSHSQRENALAPSDLLRSYFGDQLSVNIP